MGFSLFLIGFVLFNASVEINAQGPPKVTGSYRATGEMVETLEDLTNLPVQIAFEESFDADTNNAAFNIWVMGKNATFIENFDTKQTFKYTDGKDCVEMTAKEWIETKSPPSLMSYEDTNGVVRFSLKQLFALDDKYLKETNVPETYRGIPARKWIYEIPGQEKDGQARVISIHAYWSDGTWNTTSNEDQVPLGFIAYKRDKDGAILHEQFINVFGFVPNTIDHKLFEPIQGVICPNRKQTIKFPDVSKWQAVSLHSEVILPEYKQIKHVDVWFDPINKIVRQDMSRVNNQREGYSKYLTYQTEIVLGKFGVVYQIRHFKDSETCYNIGVPDFDFDLENLINFKADLPDWSIGSLFGINRTTYTYIGKTSKRDIPCHLFQGVRTDWPQPSAGVTTLWEWCFSTNLTTKDNSVIFRNSEYGLVSAQVYIMKSKNPDFRENDRIFHHFYDVNLMDPKMMDATAFDGIDDCFDEDYKRSLQFVIDWQVNDDNVYLIENATSDINFLQIWKSALYRYSGIEPSSLRLTNVKAIIAGKELVIKFTILDIIHQFRPVEAKMGQIRAVEAEKKLRENIKNRAFFVYYTPSKKAKPMKLGVVPETLRLQLNDTFVPHELPRLTSTTPPPTRENLAEIKNLHEPGTVAGVSIAMVIAGISIGASVVYVKFNGLPARLKCSGK